MPRRKKDEAAKPYVIRDTREKPGHGWMFQESNTFGGTQVIKIPTGDYSLEGLERVVCIERKGSASEFFGNLFGKEEESGRFRRELERMRRYAVAAIILEFNSDDVINWQNISAIPSSLKQRINKWAFMASINELHIDYPNIQIIFAGSSGKEWAGSLLKRAWEQYGVK